MSKLDIVFVSPIPLLPVTGGGQKRILEMIEYFRGNGYTVGLIVIDHGENTSLLSEKVDKLFNYSHDLYHKFKSLVKSKSFIERNINQGFNDYCVEKINLISPYVVISSFVWTADILHRLPKSILTVLDTIDVQHVRWKNAEKFGGDLSSRYCTEVEEKRELVKADILLSIQKDEKCIFEDLCPGKKVMSVEHAVYDFENYRAETNSKVLFFVGNDYDPNTRGMQKFLREVWPAVYSQDPQAELIVCGKVCDKLKEFKGCKGVRLLGFVDSLEEHYRRAAIVLNPVLYGTGLPIKTIEGFSHGKCLVCTEYAVSTLSNDSSEIPAIVCDFEEMATVISDLLISPKRREEIERQSWVFAKQNFTADIVYGELHAAVKSHHDTIQLIDEHRQSRMKILLPQNFDTSVSADKEQSGIKTLFKSLVKVFS